MSHAATLRTPVLGAARRLIAYALQETAAELSAAAEAQDRDRIAGALAASVAAGDLTRKIGTPDDPRAESVLDEADLRLLALLSYREITTWAAAVDEGRLTIEEADQITADARTVLRAEVAA